MHGTTNIKSYWCFKTVQCGDKPTHNLNLANSLRLKRRKHQSPTSSLSRQRSRYLRQYACMTQL